MANESITNDMINDFSKYFSQEPKHNVIMNAIMKNGINQVALNNESIINLKDTFSLEIDTGKVTNQKKSGRCWMFAALNTFRHKISEKYNIKDFELSQNYTMFWDKLEKANYFLENIIDTINEDISSRIVTWLLEYPVPDGGQWDMLCNLVAKYGVVPKDVMPETYQSSQSAMMNELLDLKLRSDASIIRKMYNDGYKLDDIRQKKVFMMSEIYSMLCYFLGTPPKKFDFEYRDKDKCFHRDSNLTPLEFFKKYVDIDLNDYVSIINAPTNDKPFEKTFTVKYLGNVVGGKNILYLNLNINVLKKLAIDQLKDNETVWFGCDVAKWYDKDLGIMDTNLFEYDETLSTTLNLTKAERLDYRNSCLTHAMVLTGVNIVDNKPNRWKVENSWGDEPGKKGYFIMSDGWFDQYLYQIVINKKYLSPELLKALEQKPIELEPWDPMGSLALMI